jgi:hypothetical protein
MTNLVDAYLGMMALRQSGYKSTATAIAELVDNSLESKAEHIHIIAVSELVQQGVRTSNHVTKIAVLDDGEGMPIEVLSKCLSLGWGTRLETREGLGRFGFGLKGSSLSQCRRVTVYTWQSKGAVYGTYWDLDEIKHNKQQTLLPATKMKLPAEIVKAFGDKIGDTGTLVLWEKLDQIDVKRADTLLTRINKTLCRTYRHFLDEDDTYGVRRDVWVHMLQDGNEERSNSVQLKATDPIYLLTPNNLPGFEKESTNLLHEKFTVPFEYHDGTSIKSSNVEFIFTIAKPSIQTLGGSDVVGKHYKANTGISFVRAGREIDMGSFGFYEVADTRHRWWGAEVRFLPVLDELFGVTSDKQHVRNIKAYDDDHNPDSTDEQDMKANFLAQINKILTENIDNMWKIIKGRKEGSRSEKAETGGLTKLVNVEVARDQSPTESADRAKQLSVEEKVAERVRLLIDDDEALTEEEAVAIAQETIDYRVEIRTGSWPGDLFLDRRAVANASVGIINRNTEFFENFWRHLSEQEDKKGFQALEVVMMALVRAEDELVRDYDRKIFEKFRQKWGSWVERLIGHAGA